MDNQTMMREQQEQQRRTLAMRKEEETVLGDQTAWTESRMDFKLDETKNWQRSEEMTRQLGLYGMDTLESFHAENYKATEQERQEKNAKFARLNEEAARTEEKKQKKSKQEKAAKKRLDSKEHQYFGHGQTVLKNAVTNVETQKDNGQIEAAYALTGAEFAVDAEGKMLCTPEELLKKQEELELYIDQQKNKLQNPGSMSNIEMDVLAPAYGGAYGGYLHLESQNRELNAKIAEAQATLDLYKDVVNKWFLANGIDYSNRNNVKNVGRLKAGSAQKSFALALESYQERMKHKEKNLFEERLKCATGVYDNETDVASDEKYRKTGLKKADGSIIPLKEEYQQQIEEIRSKEEENQAAYQKNKKIIDRIYKELLQTSVEMTQKEHDAQVQHRRMERYERALDDGHLKEGNGLRHIKRNDAIGIDMGDVDRTKDWMAVQQIKELAVLEQKINRQLAMLGTLLEGEETGDLSVDVQLHDQYGFTTNVYKEASEKIAQMEKMKKKGMTDEKIGNVLFHQKKQEEAMQLAREKKEELIQLAEEKQREMQLAGENRNDNQAAAESQVQEKKPVKMTVNFNMSSVQDVIKVKNICGTENGIKNYFERQHRAAEFTRMAEGGIYKNNVLNSALYVNLPTVQAVHADNSKEEIPVEKYLINLELIDRLGDDISTEEYGKLLQDETILLRTEKERISKHLAPHWQKMCDVKPNSWLTMEEIYEMLEVLVPVQEEADVLCKRVKKITGRENAFQEGMVDKLQMTGEADEMLRAADYLSQIIEFTTHLTELYKWEIDENKNSDDYENRPKWKGYF